MLRAPRARERRRAGKGLEARAESPRDVRMRGGIGRAFVLGEKPERRRAAPQALAPVVVVVVVVLGGTAAGRAGQSGK